MATLDFKGKALVQNYHLTVKYHQLVPKKDKSLTGKVCLDDNLIIHGDNLKALKALLPTYAGKAPNPCSKASVRVSGRKVWAISPGKSSWIQQTTSRKATS